VLLYKKENSGSSLAGFFLLLALPGLGLGALLTRLLSSANLELALGILTLTTAFIFVSANQKYTDTGQDRVLVKQARRCGWLVSLMAVPAACSA
jgi:uncharacterized membrane protein YfcA